MALPTAEQGTYLSSLEDVANIIQKAQANIKKCPKARLTEGYVKIRMKTIDEYWSTYKDTHNALLKITPREQRGMLPYFLNEEYYKIEELYLCLQGDVSDILIKLENQHKGVIDASANTSTSSEDSHLSQARLPRIQLPIFSGKYEDWPTYEDLFTALVHNTSLSNVQKLHYLKTSVSGEAEILLRHIQITENNYTQAWDLLKGRFGNKRMIVTSILKRMFGQKRVSNQSANQIKSILDTTTECINNFKNLKISTDSWDPIIIFLVTQKLDPESVKDWEEQAQQDKGEDMPTWEQMRKFLEAKFRTLELIAPMYSSKERAQPQKSFHVMTEEDEEDGIFQSAHASVAQDPLCIFCDGSHFLFNCKEFGKQTVGQRREFVRNKRLCYNCLIPNHSVYLCKQKTSCRICKKKHHSLLHEAKQDKKEESTTEQEITSAHYSKEQSGHEVILATAQIKVKANNGESHILRALIDQGSEASFVSSRAVELLGLRKTHINGVVSGVGEGTQVQINHFVNLSITSHVNETDELAVKAYILKKISTKLPSKQITANWEILNKLELADPTYHTPSGIDILLGADIFGKIIENGLIKMPDGIIAQRTIFGWILSGQRENKTAINQHNIITLHVTRMISEDNDLLKKFWEIETDLYKKKVSLSKEEDKCEEIYKETTKRDESGRYVVYLPLKYSIEETVERCGDTKQQAINRFKHLERKFERNEKFKMEYTKVVNEYKTMGHMEKCEDDDNDNSIYLPHHAVIREDKDTSKLRVVFDASAKGSNGKSLNDLMMIGPVLQTDLRSLIIAWRKHKICVIGDIIKMYRMVLMTPEHTNLQRIVWREDPNEKLESYNLKTVTFGTAAAPFLAVRTLNQLADDEAANSKYSKAESVIKTNFYMDDLMAGEDDLENAKTMCHEIRSILKRGGFEMQKWSSNSEELLEYLQQDDHTTRDTIDIKLDKVIRILGLTWDRKEDVFKITVSLPDVTYPVTKRSILSDVARLFDPFGWLSPVVIKAKILIQKLWVCSLGWDDELPLDLTEEWRLFREQLSHLKNITIPRWLKTTNHNINNVELHGFADASTQAYAAVAYLRIVTGDAVDVRLIASRTKVAPLKQLSVPKLELCAAALLADLINDLTETLQIKRDRIFVWTDSMVVLAWLQAQPSRWRTFVANRVAEITRVLDNSMWRHVQSADNPADIATRGIIGEDLVSQEAWWTGPIWLNQIDSNFQRSHIPPTELEMKSSFHIRNERREDASLWERFSSLTRMKRVLAYCRRFLKKVKSGEDTHTYITVDEMEIIEERCIKYYQGVIYEREIEELKEKGSVKRRSSLITLSPFLDNKDLIRVGGRLNNARIPDTMKHPIVIPNNQHITNLLINEAHIKTLHGGVQLMMAYIRTKYWIVGLKSAVKKCIRLCKTCIVDKARTRNQYMGQLPSVRVNEHRAFINSGVDYAGPIMIRTSKGRGQHATKGYICLFVCMSTRAIHLEAVTDLTSQAFLAAFRRFVARRGRCLHLWSDNGTNFVGAAKELKELFVEGKGNLAKEVAELLATDGTTWHFIPPKMPNCGGLWEAGVQSAKRHLARVNKDTKLTYEEMATLLTQIEACLNSRPLCQIDNTTDTPLTPGHFLIGESLLAVPDLNYENKKFTLQNRWQLIQRMTQDFWSQWRTEYLNTLQQRYKWQVAGPNPVIGDMVVIKEDDTPPTKWLLGRIKYLHPGKDNIVRVVTVQCKGNHELKRPLSKLIPLPNVC